MAAEPLLELLHDLCLVRTSARAHKAHETEDWMRELGFEALMTALVQHNCCDSEKLSACSLSKCSQLEAGPAMNDSTASVQLLTMLDNLAHRVPAEYVSFAATIASSI